MNSTLSIRAIALCSALAVFSSCAGTGIYGPGSGGQTSSPGQRGNSQAAVRVNITVAEARRLAAAHNLAGRRALPPGIQRNLARGKPLPPGIARQMVPQGMLSGLPSYEGHEWRIAGKDLILIALGTLLVVEILSGVFD